MSYKSQHIVLFFFFLVNGNVYSQTCCSGGTPLTGNLGIQGIEAKSWYFQLSYDYNFLDDLYSGTLKLDDHSRERVTQTVLLQAIYSFSEKISVNSLFSYVEQKRTIFSPTGATNITQASGLGDVVLLFQYTPFTNLKRSLTLAVGPKLPLGKFDAVDLEYGLVLSTDLQPGSGSWDGIIGASYKEFHLLNFPGLTFTGSAGYRVTTPAQRFDGDFKYRFGSETILGFGIQKNLLLKRVGVTPSVSLNYRNTAQDKVDGSVVAGTGGNWLNLIPSLNIEPANKWAINISGEVPIYRNLNGTQLTTSYRLNIGFVMKLFNN
jgi:hypothetical protein